MLFLFGLLVLGLVIRRIGKSIEKAFREERPTINYHDNRQYHYTEVHNHERSADRATDEAPFSFRK